MLAEHFGNDQNEIGGGGAFGEFADEFEADDFGEKHVDGLAEHDGLGLDAADAPADDAEAVDHGGVGVGADEGIGVEDGIGRFLTARLSSPKSVAALRFPDDFGEVFEVNLVDDAGGGRDDAEVVEGLLAPFEELVAFVVAFEFALGVDGEGGGGGEGIDLDGVVDDEVAGDEGIDLGGVAVEAEHGGAHGGEIDDTGDAGEILEDDASGHEGDFGVAGTFRIVAGDGEDIVVGDDVAIDMAEAGFEEDLDGVGEAVDVGDAAEGVETVDGLGTERGLEGVAGVEGVYIFGVWGDGHGILAGWGDENESW